jgi:hypothetical protein
VYNTSLNAIILGRLRMSTKEAITHYGKLSRAVFGTRNRNSLKQEFFYGMRLENAIKGIVKACRETKSEDEKMLDTRLNFCKT